MEKTPALFCKFDGQKGILVEQMKYTKYVFQLQCPQCDSFWLVTSSLETQKKIQEPYFTPEMVFTNMLRLWKAEDIKDFYDMLGRRPEAIGVLINEPVAKDVLQKLFAGCGNQACRVRKPEKGVYTNGPCKCAERLREYREAYEY